MQLSYAPRYSHITEVSPEWISGALQSSGSNGSGALVGGKRSVKRVGMELSHADHRRSISEILMDDG